MGTHDVIDKTGSTYTTTTILRPFFRDHPGEPVTEENFWTLWCKERLTEADTLTIRLGVTPSGLTSAHLHHPPYIHGTETAWYGDGAGNTFEENSSVFSLTECASCLQCFDIVGWAAGTASSRQKIWGKTGST